MSEESGSLRAIVDVSLDACLKWVKKTGSGGLRMVDPLDGRPVVAHYGDSHLAAALIILGELRDDQRLVEQGIRLLQTVLAEWDESSKCFDFHHDFNNFALCVIHDYSTQLPANLRQEIRDVVLASNDSKHLTINWLPMRAYVNDKRHEWTGEKRFNDAKNTSLHLVGCATNADGGIEDRYPFGKSYNLQYNVSSLATLLLIKKGGELADFDLDRGLSFLLECVLPDGDINYVGRGVNQIFAWGPWLYALSVTNRLDDRSQALDYLTSRYPTAANNANILLNEFPGSDKTFWWDYHYCTVYHAHFLFWSVLALHDEAALPSADAVVEREETGIEIKSGQSGGGIIFRGREIYLAESGPVVCALWHKEKGMLFKGGLGPWQGMFGAKYSFGDAVLQNHFGLVSQSTAGSNRNSRILNRLRASSAEDRTVKMQPIFGQLDIRFEADEIRIEMEAETASAYFNVPLFAHLGEDVQVQFHVDGEPLQGIDIGTTRNQYGWVRVIRSRATRGRCWQVTIR